MRVFRIAKASHIRDLSGSGARLYGGRWNRKGIPVIYTSESRSLATVEYVVHVPLSIVPKDLRIVCLEIPDEIAPEEISIADLPGRWQDYPAPPELAEIGTQWALAKKQLLLRVPSAVVENEFNILINPVHPQSARVRISRVERCTLDKRLLRQK